MASTMLEPFVHCPPARELLARATRYVVTLAVAIGCGGHTALAEDVAAPIDFNRQIRPILSDHCFACHGPDTNTLQAGLRLDITDGVFKPAESGEIPVVPSDAEASELVRRIVSPDADQVMPPPEGKPLTPEQIALLTEWVKQGAPWSRHWAFEPVRTP
ncbi:MAG: hypothetical protein EHM77_08575, partial [Planctomycetaceae bacterium]